MVDASAGNGKHACAKSLCRQGTESGELKRGSAAKTASCRVLFSARIVMVARKTREWMRSLYATERRRDIAMMRPARKGKVYARSPCDHCAYMTRVMNARLSGLRYHV